MVTVLGVEELTHVIKYNTYSNIGDCSQKKVYSKRYTLLYELILLLVIVSSCQL